MLGVAYFPALFCSIPLLIWISGQGQGAVIGSLICLMMFGLPVLCAELSFRLSHWLSSKSTPGRI
jgi:hypothetical protein